MNFSSYHFNLLKGQCHKIYDHFFLLKIFNLGPIWTGKNNFANFIVFAKKFLQKTCVSVVIDYAATASPCQRLRGHCLSIVNNYTNTCQRSQRLCRHHVSTVNNYADTPDFWTLQLNIFAKTKKFAKPNIYMGPRSNLLSKKNGQKSCDTVPLNNDVCMYVTAHKPSWPFQIFV